MPFFALLPMKHTLQFGYDAIAVMLTSGGAADRFNLYVFGYNLNLGKMDL